MNSLSLRLTFGILLAGAPFIATAASVGQTEREVRNAHGKATSTMAVGAKKILVYPEGKVTLVDGKVTDVSGDLDAGPAVSEDSSDKKSFFKKKKSSDSPAAIPPYLAKFNTHLVNASGKRISDPGLAQKKYILVYYSASWCPPCRKFTPGLVDFYKKHKKDDNFEFIFVSADRSAADTSKYMKDYKMTWPAVRFDHIRSSGLQGKGGNGIPSLLLFDQKGKVVSSSYRGSQYLGPGKVLKDLEKRL